ncbi:hypothetical protein IW146_002470 [Coemansia sp. RSA 922]|nr:hypothetical protein GGI14_001492 [Coemansia sp. S680]KAJ2051830.1 hypothetical protein H4S04_001732 [Coemansia sp. S16]KAJ2115234.1 hypothetical protein IW146_002470 [Coemansia sp. RSA 922]
MHSIVAATSDTVRVWDLEVTSPRPAASSTYQRARRGSSNTVGSFGSDHEVESAHASMSSAYSADGAGKAIDSITTVSWAANGNTFAVGGRGSTIRQYSRTGELLQDMKPGRRADQLGVADIAAVQHYGASSEALFVAINSTKQVRRWDFVRKDYTAVCQTHENDISCMAVCTKKRIVASATAQGGEIAVFNLLHNTRTDLRSATHKALTCIDISPGLRSQIAVGSEDGLLQLFDTSRSGLAPLKAFSHVHSAPVRGIAFHPVSSATILSVGLDGRIAMTDTNAYASGNSSAGINVASPPTCLATTQDSYVIGVGTIDGDVLVYDTRGSATPLWRGSTGSRRTVTSISLTRRVDASAESTSQPLRRAASTSSTSREARDTNHGAIRNAPGSLDERPIASSLAERQRTRSSAIAGVSVTRENRPPISAAAADVAKGDGCIRPPHHPSINRFRSAINEHRMNTAVNGGSAKPMAVPTQSAADGTGTRSPRVTKADYAPEGGTSEDDVDNMALLMKDRSYMELLSPAKTTTAVGQSSREAHGARHNDDILALLSRSRTAAKAPSLPAASSRVSLKSPAKAVDHTSNLLHSTPTEKSASSRIKSPPNVSSCAVVVDDMDTSPMPQPHRPAARGRLGPRTHDAGDSMMEMFTPERNKPSLLPAQLPKSSSGPVGNGLSTNLAHTLVAQLLEKQEEKTCSDSTKLASSGDGISLAAHRPSVNFVSRSSSDRFLEPPAQASAGNTPVAVPNEHSGESSDKQSAKLILPSRHLATNRSAVGIELLSPPDCLPPAPKRPCREEDQPGMASSAAVMSGLGDIGSSVLQNLLADALTPLREQLRGEIRNLHLDMIRQGFVYQEQVRALRQECNEARDLRQELDKLRRENEQLRRHIPFFGSSDSAAAP